MRGTFVAGRFRLVRVLGEGGMGSVWVAQDTKLDTPCAMKFIHGEAAESPDLCARFEREAKIAAQLRSPNVVQILDYGISDEMPYIAMELLEGEDLAQRLDRVGALAPAETVSIVAQVARALTKAHAAGLVHRDLKPANIFLAQDDDRELAKVLDFGVAKQSVHELSGSTTKTGVLLGTPYYMSPEQTRGTRAVDHRSDLWALAVIVFQCLTGRLPFVSEALGDLFLQIASDPIPVPSHAAPHLPATFDAWWVRATMREPKLRFQTAKELVEALALSLGLSLGRGVESTGVAWPLVVPPPPPSAPASVSAATLPTLASSPPQSVTEAAITRTAAGPLVPEGPRTWVAWLLGAAMGVASVGGGAAVYAFAFRHAPAANAVSAVTAAGAQEAPAAPLGAAPPSPAPAAPAPEPPATAEAAPAKHAPEPSAPEPSAPEPSATATPAPPPPPSPVKPGPGRGFFKGGRGPGLPGLRPSTPALKTPPNFGI